MKFVRATKRNVCMTVGDVRRGEKREQRGRGRARGPVKGHISTEVSTYVHTLHFGSWWRRYDLLFTFGKRRCFGHKFLWNAMSFRQFLPCSPQLQKEWSELLFGIVVGMLFTSFLQPSAEPSNLASNTTNGFPQKGGQEIPNSSE